MRRVLRDIVVIVSAVTALAACNGPPVGGGASWTGPDGKPAGDAVEVYTGPDHCHWEDTVFLELHLEAVDRERAHPGIATYVRDPASVGLTDAYLASTYAADAKLPEDAVHTGYESGGTQLWWVPGGLEEAIYLVTDSNTERWPALLAGCA